MNKPEIILSENTSNYRRDRFNKPDCAQEQASKSGEEQTRDDKKGGRLKSFLVRAAVTLVLLALVFLPRFIPYKGSEAVTNVVKTVIMTDITANENVGSGKLVDIFNEIFKKADEQK